MTNPLPLLVFLAFAQGHSYEAPGIPATSPNPAYPLRLRVLSNNRSHSGFGYHGYGRGDLLSSPAQGLDYTFDCERGFLRNAHATEFYQGRWKKPGQKLEVLVQQVGTQHVERCNLNVTLRPEPYGR